MKTDFKANFSATAIGSFPHTQVDDACNLVLQTIPEVPCWPQLSATGIREEMCIQYTEGLPGFKIDVAQKVGYIDDTGDFSSELESFYSKYIAQDCSAFAMNPAYSVGFSALMNAVERSGCERLRAIKGQIVGPITLAGITKDMNKVSILHNDVSFDTIVKILAMKACWQLEQFARFDVPKIIFVDEPYLASIGSAFANIDKNKVITSLNEIFGAIHDKGGLAGIHCCGNTDWSMLIDTTVDIVNFDAFGYMDPLLLYWNEVKRLLERGGILAWGIVPTSNDIIDISVDSLLNKMNTGIDRLTDKGIERELIHRNSLITPSCGTGSLSCDTAQRVMEFTGDISSKLKDKLA